MKQKTPLVVFCGLLLFLLFEQCGRTVKMEEQEVTSRVPVKVTGIIKGTLHDYVDMIASSSFQNKSVVQAPAAAYIRTLSVLPGDFVKKNQELLTLTTKEAEALQKDTLSSFSFSGIISIKAAIDGIVTGIDHSKGDYVMEGSSLLTIALPGSFVFILEAPFEISSLLRQGTNCEIILPDNRSIKGIIRSRLPSMTTSSQTQRILIQPQSHESLPEGLIAKIRVVRQIFPNAILLPRKCILSDEILQNFWVMKLINDSMAVKVPVKTGITDGDNIGILEPLFSDTDRFLSSGNYGLGDTAKVIVR